MFTFSLHCYHQLYYSSDHGTGQVAERAKAVGAKALPANAPQVVSVQDHADHTVLKLLRHNVEEYDVQHCARVHQEGGEGPPGVVTPLTAGQQHGNETDVERHKAHQHLNDQCDDDPDGLLLDFGLQFGRAAVDEVVHDDNVTSHHDAHRHQEEEDDTCEVDGIVTAQVDYVVHLDAGGIVCVAVRVFLQENKRSCAAQGHDPDSRTGQQGFTDTF